MHVNKLGIKLRELRIKNELSQEYVAGVLGVSVQAVSKWENGKSSPDIMNLVPISDLFHIPVDELLDKDKRRRDWERRIDEALISDDRETPFRVLRDALAEFPGDRRFRYQLACWEFFAAQEETDPAERKRLLDLADDRLKSLNREYPEYTAAADMRVRVLTALERRDEAASLARTSPNRERLLLFVLEGDELAAHQRKTATVSLLNLLGDLMREGSPEALDMVESIVTDAAGQDGQLMDFLMGAYYRQALGCCESGQPEEAMAVLEKAYQALATFEERKGGKGRSGFLFPLMPRRTRREAAAQLAGFLLDERFDGLRENPGFRMVQTGVLRIAEEA